MSDDGRVEWVKLTEYSARYLAEIDIQTLEGQGVPVMVRGEEAGIWGPAFAGPTSQGIQIMVPSNALEDARALLDLDAEDDD